MQEMVNGKWTALIQRFPKQWPLKVLFNVASDSPMHTHTHNHTPTGESTMEGDSQLVRSSQGEVSCSGIPRYHQEPGIELATFRLHLNSLYLLSQMPPEMRWDGDNEMFVGKGTDLAPDVLWVPGVPRAFQQNVTS